MGGGGGKCGGGDSLCLSSRIPHFPVLRPVPLEHSPNTNGLLIPQPGLVSRKENGGGGAVSLKVGIFLTIHLLFKLTYIFF